MGRCIQAGTRRVEERGSLCLVHTPPSLPELQIAQVLDISARPLALWNQPPWLLSVDGALGGFVGSVHGPVAILMAGCFPIPVEGDPAVHCTVHLRRNSRCLLSVPIIRSLPPAVFHGQGAVLSPCWRYGADFTQPCPLGVLSVYACGRTQTSRGF